MKILLVILAIIVVLIAICVAVLAAAARSLDECNKKTGLFIKSEKR